MNNIMEKNLHILPINTSITGSTGCQIQVNYFSTLRTHKDKKKIWW